MMAISLWQPWASLWLSPAKIHETRHWPISHRGLLAVHATKKFVRDFPDDDPLQDILDAEFGHHWGIDLPTGAVIGVVRLVACLPTESTRTTDDDRACGDFSPGRYSWRRGDEYYRLPRPMRFSGKQRLFTVPDELFGSADLRMISAMQERESNTRLPL